MDECVLIINADDFGATREINSAIVTCFKRDIINSTTIMVNMPYFNEAVELAFQNSFSNKIGIHINLTTGKPLTDLNETRLVDQYGCFVQKELYNPSIFFSGTTRRKIQQEIFAQYEKLCEAKINPTHVDSHHHVHHLPWLAPLFIKLAREKDQKLRVCMTKRRINFFKTFYRLGLNRRLKINNLNFTDTFGSASSTKKYLDKNKNTNRTFEVMVHPDIKENELIDHCDPESFKYLKELRSRCEMKLNNAYQLL